MFNNKKIYFLFFLVSLCVSAQNSPNPGDIGVKTNTGTVVYFRTMEADTATNPLQSGGVYVKTVANTIRQICTIDNITNNSVQSDDVCLRLPAGFPSSGVCLIDCPAPPPPPGNGNGNGNDNDPPPPPPGNGNGNNDDNGNDPPPPPGGSTGNGGPNTGGTSSPPPPGGPGAGLCGNNVRDNGEQCDGDDDICEQELGPLTGPWSYQCTPDCTCGISNTNGGELGQDLPGLF